MDTGQQKVCESGKIQYDSIQDVASVVLSRHIVSKLASFGRFERIQSIKSQSIGEVNKLSLLFSRILFGEPVI